jgi:hypothetical protein
MTSVHELIQREICNKGINLVRINYRGKSMDPAAAILRTHTGETVSPEKVAHARFILTASTGTRKASLNLTMSHDKGSRNEDGAFDFRSVTIATMDIFTGAITFNVPKISILRNFKSKDEWEEIDLRKCDSLFPVTMDETEIENILTLSELRAERDHLSNEIDKAKKRKAIKEQREEGIKQDGYRFFYTPPNPNPAPIATFIEVATGERIGGDKVEFDTVELTAPNGPDFKGEKVKNEGLVKAVRRLKEVREEIKELNRTTRPLELGIIEDSIRAARELGEVSTLTSFVWCGFGFDILRGKDKEYKTDRNIGQRIKRGEVKIEMNPPTRNNGKWELEPVEVPPATNKVKTGDKETVTA